MTFANRSNTFLNQALQGITFVYQLVAVATFITALFLANWWTSFPFIGAFYEHTMVFNGVVPSGPDSSWDLRNQGIKLGDQLISVNGQAVHSTVEVQRILSSFQPGDQIPVIVRSADGVQKTYNVTLNTFPLQDRITYYIIPISLSLVFLVLSIWIFAIRRRETAGRAFALFASSFSMGAGSLFDLYTTHSLTYFWTLSLAIGGGALVDLVLAFRRKPVYRSPFLSALGRLRHCTDPLRVCLYDLIQFRPTHQLYSGLAIPLHFRWLIQSHLYSIQRLL